MGKTRKSEKWAEILQFWKHSGLGGAAYCRKNRISLGSFYSWKRRLSASAGKLKRPAFLPVEVITSSGENSIVMELVLKNGRVLRLYREMPVADLAQMVQALESVVC